MLRQFSLIVQPFFQFAYHKYPVPHRQWYHLLLLSASLVLQLSRNIVLVFHHIQKVLLGTSRTLYFLIVRSPLEPPYNPGMISYGLSYQILNQVHILYQ